MRMCWLMGMLMRMGMGVREGGLRLWLRWRLGLLRRRLLLLLLLLLADAEIGR